MPPNRCFKGWRALRPGNHDEICTRERAPWFAQPARRQQVTSAERIRRVHEHDVHVPLQLQMLKAIVEDKPLDSFRAQSLASRKPVRSHAQCDGIPQSRLEKAHFITRRLSTRKLLTATAISSRQYSYSLPFRKQARRDPGHHRRFACAPNCEIADADDFPFQPPSPEHS